MKRIEGAHEREKTKEKRQKKPNENGTGKKLKRIERTRKQSIQKLE